MKEENGFLAFLGDIGDGAVKLGKGALTVGKEVADFFILDDINTIMDPNASGADKGFAVASFIPIGKLVKGGKLIGKIIDSDVDDVVKKSNVDEVVDKGKDGAKKIINKDGTVTVKGEGDITEVIDNRPYLDPKNRPSFRKGVPETTFENAKGPDGLVRDPLHIDQVIEWEPGQPRRGVWDMGHLPEHKYSEVHKKYLNGELTPKEFRDWFNNPDNYRPELPSTNRSHKIE